MRDALRRALCGSIAGWVLGVAAAVPAHSAVFVVSTTAADGAGSLRQAILDANANPGTDTIAFAIPEPQCSAAGVCTIHLTSVLPDLTDPVIVDGTTQPRHGSAPENVCATETAPSYMRVEIDLDGAGYFDAVLRLGAAADQAPSTFRGLAIAGSMAIEIRPPGAHRVQCNHLGVNGPGTALLNADADEGVLLQYFARGVWIGTDGDGLDDVGEGNVIAGTGLNVNINANLDNVIAGNTFGLAADGVTPLACYVAVFMRQSSHGNRVGTDFDGVSDELERNVIGGCSIGVWLFEEAGGPGNAIAGNWLGVDASGAPRPNQKGIDLRYEGSDRLIAYNRIESNAVGIAIDGDATGTLDPASRGNCFANNGTAFSHGGSAAVVFENNWWGAADGPSGLGTGSGDAVSVSGSGSLDWTPWETDGCPAPEPDALAAAIAAIGALALRARERAAAS